MRLTKAQLDALIVLYDHEVSVFREGPHKRNPAPVAFFKKGHEGLERPYRRLVKLGYADFGDSANPGRVTGSYRITKKGLARLRDPMSLVAEEIHGS